MKLALLLIAAATTSAGVCDLCQSPVTVARSIAVPVTSRITTQVPAAVGAATVPALDTVALHIEGMTCGGCTIATRKVLERLDGVTKAEVDYEQKRAVVTYDPSKVTVARMITAVATLKYTATVIAPGVQPGATPTAGS